MDTFLGDSPKERFPIIGFLGLLLISATVKMWCGKHKGWHGKHGRGCAKDNIEVKSFIWDSDSGEIDIETISDDDDVKGEIKDILNKLPKRIVYVSCNPASQARDIALLCNKYFDLVKLRPIDMFPHTPHIENVATLTLQ